MNKKQIIAHSILWAAAIVAAAIVHAPAILTAVLLPVLWGGSFLVAGSGRCEREPRAD